MDDCLILIAKNYWLEPSNYLAIFKVLIGLGAVIFVHELGHFLLAKACGVKCEKFYVGFDVPIKLFGRTIIPGKLVHWQWGETEYGIGSIPLGGYVKMLGQDDNPGNLEEQVQGSIAEGESVDSAMLASGLIDRSKLDPRSFLAKSVMQRMFIISAGVIFNLVFAIFFAAWAFKTGVNYEPAVVGTVVGGGPAWVNNMVGAEVKSIGDTQVEGYFPFGNMAEAIIFNAGDEMTMTVIPYGQTDSVTFPIVPQKGILRHAPDLALIGISNRLIPVVGNEGTTSGDAASQAKPAIEPHDVIVEINGTPITSDIDLRRVLARDVDKIANFVLERKNKDNPDSAPLRISTAVPANPMRMLGFSVEWLPIAAIQIGSPAESAGLSIGDEIITINGEPRGDLMTLDKRMVSFARLGEAIDLGVIQNGAMKTVSIVPIVPGVPPDVGPNLPIAIDSLGVAIPTNRVVEAVEPGSVADKSGIEIGDQLVSIKYLLTDEQKKEDRFRNLKKKPLRKFEDDNLSWGEVFGLLQRLKAGSQLELVVKRGSSEQTLEMKTVASDQFFQSVRGISLTPMQRNYKSDTWSDAFQHGTTQVGNDMTRVLKTLRQLIRGKISPKNLGGPGTIALVATSEASQGTSRLLLFLTFLSANLAVINFLPIPILDGGHMMFLAYEGIFRRPVNERVQLILTYGGLAMILTLMAFVLFLDFGRIF